MNNSSIRLIFLALLAFWVVLTGASLLWNVSQHRAHVRDMVLSNGKTLFSLMETARFWNALRGGVYVPVDEANQPNPHLDVPNRDIQVGDLKLTLINPAYMTRQISELAMKRDGVNFHITSLNPLRPGNAADPWEASALASFEKGVKETLSEAVPSAKGEVFRYMAPLVTQQACLNCHEKQGYKLGDIRGGISVDIPAGPLIKVMEEEKQRMILLHLSAFLLLSGLSFAFLRALGARIQALEETKIGQEQLILQRTEELRRSNKELELFAYAASHDLQEPLRMVASYVDLLKKRYEDKLDSEAKEFIGYASDGAKRLSRMIKDILDYSRIDRQGGVMIDIEMDSSLDLAMENLRGQIESSQAIIKRDCLPRAKADGTQLSRLFQNLISNAIKYARKGETPSIHIGTRTDPNRGGATVYFVRDNGVGIPTDKLEDVFMLFSRLHNGHDHADGLGIGLAACKRIIIRHGGDIWVESEVGVGSTFCFTMNEMAPTATDDIIP